MGFDYIVSISLLPFHCVLFFVFEWRTSFVVGSSFFFFFDCSSPCSCDFGVFVNGSHFKSFYSAILFPSNTFNFKSNRSVVSLGPSEELSLYHFISINEVEWGNASQASWYYASPHFLFRWCQWDPDPQQPKLLALPRICEWGHVRWF